MAHNTPARVGGAKSLLAPQNF